MREMIKENLARPRLKDILPRTGAMRFASDRSLLLDLKILLKTIPALLKREGAF